MSRRKLLGLTAMAVAFLPSGFTTNRVLTARPEKRGREFQPKKTNQKKIVIEGVVIEALNYKNAVRKYKNEYRK